MNLGTGYLLSDGRDLSDVFIRISDSASLASQNTFPLKQTFKGDVDLSGSLMFYDLPAGIQSAPYPIGYTLDASNTVTNPTTGVIYNAEVTISPGVWLTTCSFTLNKGNGGYTNNSFFRLDISNSLTQDILFSPPQPLLRIPIDISNALTSNSIQVVMTAVAIVKKAPSTTMRGEALVTMTVGSSTTFTVYLEVTKIA